MDFGSGDEATSRLPGNGELWERVINGDCARIVLLTPPMRRSMFELYFPQTFGLRPLSSHSYYAPANSDLSATARDLAATDRWVVEGTNWIEHFLPRACAILDTGLKVPRTATDHDLHPRVLGITETEYAAKLIRVTSRAQIHALQKVRAHA